MTSVHALPAIRAFLFKKLVPLSPALHRGLGLASYQSFTEYQFHWLPILLSEIPEAARHFPVVLADTQMPMIAAVVGLHRRQSLFIDRMGAWTGAYLPLYLRQMPFHVVPVRMPGAPPQPAICIDTDSPLVDETFPDKIIGDTGLSDITSAAISAATEFAEGATAAGAFASALERSGLTVPLNAMRETEDCRSLRALSAVSPVRLRDAPAGVLAPFKDASLLPIVEACGQSLRSFDRLRRLQEGSYRLQETHMRADL